MTALAVSTPVREAVGASSIRARDRGNALDDAETSFHFRQLYCRLDEVARTSAIHGNGPAKDTAKRSGRNDNIGLEEFDYLVRRHKVDDWEVQADEEYEPNELFSG